MSCGPQQASWHAGPVHSAYSPQDDPARPAPSRTPNANMTERMEVARLDRVAVVSSIETNAIVPGHPRMDEARWCRRYSALPREHVRPRAAHQHVGELTARRQSPGWRGRQQAACAQATAVPAAPFPRAWRLQPDETGFAEVLARPASSSRRNNGSCACFVLSIPDRSRQCSISSFAQQKFRFMSTSNNCHL